MNFAGAGAGESAGLSGGLSDGAGVSGVGAYGPAYVLKGIPRRLRPHQTA